MAVLVAACWVGNGVARADEPVAKLSMSSELGALSKSSYGEQTAHIERVYGLLPDLAWQSEMSSLHPGAGFVTFGAAPVKEEFSPQHRLDLARAILQKHGESVAPILHRYLRSEDEARQLFGLRNLTLLLPDIGSTANAPSTSSIEMGQTWHDTIYRDLAAIFQFKTSSGQPNVALFSALQYPDSMRTLTLKQRAEIALTQLGDARAIGLLLRDDPAHPTRHLWTLARLAKITPQDAALETLVPLLRSDDADARVEALIVLPVSRPDVQRELPMLLAHPDATTRSIAVTKAFELPAPQFPALQKLLESKLADPSPPVRLSAVKGFAARKDPIAAPVLLALLRDDSIEIARGFVSEALNELIGFDSGYDAAAKPTPAIAQHNAAFARVEAWIAAHPRQ